jgi:hypothetical protein
MATNERVTAPAARPSYRLELAAVILVGAAFAVGLATGWANTDAGRLPEDSDTGTLARALLTVAGLITAGYAVACRPTDFFTLGFAAVTGFLAAPAAPVSYDSLQIVGRIGGMLALLGMAAAAMPPAGRKVLLSLVVIFHFGGIVTAITSPPPQPWITGQLWSRVYRPYLQFMYLNNAYHFYSPEPGPASLLWFCLEYSDEKDPTKRRYQWFETPRRPAEITDPLAISYYRRLSLTEQINQFQAPGTPTPPEVERRRVSVVTEIPFHPDMPPQQQYRPLAESTRNIQVPSYVRHVALAHPPRPGEKLESVRVYRTEHTILVPFQLYTLQFSPYDPRSYRPYFLGEFSPEGRLKHPDDPLLYWLVPVLQFPTSAAETAFGVKGAKPKKHWKFGTLDTPEGRIKDYSLMHATGKFDSDEEGGQ